MRLVPMFGVDRSVLNVHFSYEFVDVIAALAMSIIRSTQIVKVLTPQPFFVNI